MNIQATAPIDLGRDGNSRPLLSIADIAAIASSEFSKRPYLAGGNLSTWGCMCVRASTVIIGVIELGIPPAVAAKHFKTEHPKRLVLESRRWLHAMNPIDAEKRASHLESIRERVAERIAKKAEVVA